MTLLASMFLSIMVFAPALAFPPPTPTNNEALAVREFSVFTESIGRATGIPFTVSAPLFHSGESDAVRRDRYVDWLISRQRLGPSRAADVRRAASSAFEATQVYLARHPWAPPRDQTWRANASIRKPQIVTDSGVGSAQGAVVHDGHIYVYGDFEEAFPRHGLVREYDMNLNPTGRTLRLVKNGVPVSIHPTGLSFDPRWGTLLSDTWKRKGTYFKIDWERAWSDGNLDHAIQKIIDDDAATNGSRGVIVSLRGKSYIASADYEAPSPQLRLYDPEKLFASQRTQEPGVVVERLACGQFNQNLHWDPQSGRLTFVQNVIAGLGWQLESIDLAEAVARHDIRAVSAHHARRAYLPHDELEGWTLLPDGSELFVTSSRSMNLTLGVTQPIPERITPIGERRVNYDNPQTRQDRDVTEATQVSSDSIECRFSESQLAPLTHL